MSRKVTIIGAGSVGATIAYTLAVTHGASEILLIDINEKKAFGEAMDIKQGMPYSTPVEIRSGSYADAVGSDIVIITCGVARKPGQSRLDLAQTNVNILKSFIPDLEKYVPDAIFIVVANPVDILTHVLCKCSSIPENHIFGSGTILDTARLRSRLSECYHVNETNVHACVMGEHGDSSFIPWSLINISNVPAELYAKSLSGMSVEPLDREEVESYVRKSGGTVISCKGATYYAISNSVCYICRCIFSGVDTIMPLSTMMHGEYGVEDVCLSVMNIVSSNGITGKVISPLTDEELARLHKSADSLKAVLSAIEL